MTRYRLQSRKIFLTYSQCQINKDDLCAHIQTLLPIKHIIVASENHQDGGEHIHVYLESETRPNIRDHRYFDFQNYHPNIQGCRNPDLVQKYVRKDDNYIEFLDPENREKTGKTDYMDVCTTYNSQSEWMQYCVNRNLPFQYAKYFWDASHKTDSTTLYDETIEGTINNPVLVLRGVTKSPNSPSRTTVIIGPTGCGKTTWAKRRAPKPCLFITHLDQLKEFNELEHKAIIFDDMSFTHIPLQGQIHLVDQSNPNAIHRRYGTTLIPPNTDKYITCNEIPFLCENGEIHPAIKRRITYINLL